MITYNHLELFSSSEDSYTTPRKAFSSFKRSNEGYSLKKHLITKQCSLCIICKKVCIWEELELDHIIPLVLIPKGSEYLVTYNKNIQLICSHCNKKKGTKYSGTYRIRTSDNKKVLLEDFSEDIYKSYKGIIKELCSNKYKNKEIQQYWNRQLILLNTNLKAIKDKRLIIDVYPLDIDTINQ